MMVSLDGIIPSVVKPPFLKKKIVDLTKNVIYFTNTYYYRKPQNRGPKMHLPRIKTQEKDKKINF